MESGFYRLERTRLGEHLTSVASLQEATHASVALLRQMHEAHARETAGLRAEIAQARGRVGELEVQLGRAIHAVDQAQTHEAHAKEAVERLVAKHRELIGEKRRLRDALVGTVRPPYIAYRIDVDRDDRASVSEPLLLDAFPHRDHTRAALAEARRLAAQRGGRLRQLRLDTAAWRAVIQVPIDG